MFKPALEKVWSFLGKHSGLRTDGHNIFLDPLWPDPDHENYTADMSTGVTYQYLEPRAGSLYRQLFIRSTRIRAELIYRAHINAEEPMTPEGLAVDYGLPLPAILEAIEYVKSNPPEIAANIAREEAIMAATGQSDPDYKYHPHRKPLTPQEWARLLA